MCALSEVLTAPRESLPTGPLPPCPEHAPHYAVWQALESVCDPEIPIVNLREMGVLRAVREGTNGLEVVITPTYSGCPALEQMADDVCCALAGAGLRAKVVTQLAPAWSSAWLTDAARAKLQAYGIAPPVRGQPSACAAASGAAPLHFAPASGLSRADVVACPQCGSRATTEISHFASTACKALYRCLECLEPFDYFKPY